MFKATAIYQMETLPMTMPTWHYIIGQERKIWTYECALP